MTAANVSPESVETTSAGSGPRATPYASTAEQYWALGWRGLLPIVPGPRKRPYIAGHHGGPANSDTSRADVQTCIDEFGGANIGLRLPETVIGIDVDDYDEKRGGRTLIEAERRWGALPATWMSTARVDGSGIRFFTVPADLAFRSEIGFEVAGEKISDVELVWRGHRFAVVAPSIHKTGNEYRWFEPDGFPADRLPRPDEFAALPQTWVDALQREPEPDMTHPDAQPVTGTDGPMSDAVDRRLTEALDSLGGSRHDNMAVHTMALARLAEQKQPGVSEAIETFRQRFIAEVTADGSRTLLEANAEFERALNSAFRKVAQRPTVEMDVATIIRLSDRARGPQEANMGFPDGDDDAAIIAVADAVERGFASYLIDGGSFIHDEPDGVTSLWGAGDRSLWSEGEALIVCGPQGVGKTTLGSNVLAALIADVPSSVLGLPVQPVDKVLYLAMDRPRQAARALRRQLGHFDRAHLDERMTFWKGPPPHDLAKNTGMLTALAEAAHADVVIVDSLKDAAIGLSDDEVGAGWNRARQALLASGRNILELHHIKKISAEKKPDIADVYGSTWITSGAGSVVLLNGNPGDAVVRFHHVKQPVEELGPWSLIHDQQSGRMDVHGQVDLIVAAKAGLTVKDAARLLFDTDKPDRNQIEKARRKLAGLVRDGRLHSRESSNPKDPATYYAVTYRQEAS